MSKNNSFDFAKEIFKLNEYASIVENGIVAGDYEGFIDSGSYAINALLSGSIYGGYANNKITALAGPSGVGKSFFALTAVKLFLDKDPRAVVFMFESESALTKNMMLEFGIDIKRVLIMPIETVQQFRHQALVILNNYSAIPAQERTPILMVLDSLGQLSTVKEIEDIQDGKDTRDMTRAQLVKAAFRVLTLKMGKFKVPLLFTNHTYGTMEMFSKQVQSGGSGPVYSASTVMMLTKSKEKSGTDITGAVVKCRLDKGRLTRENSKAETVIRYQDGLSRWHGMVEFAIEAGIWKKAGTRIELGPEQDGAKVYSKNIYENPEKFFTEDIMKAIDEYVGKKFKYGSAFPVPDVEETEEREISEDE
jgi:RecA/RadA recombinase